MDPYTTDHEKSSKPQGFHALMRYLRVVNRHKMILVGLVAAAVFFAIVRHKRTPKRYESSAKILVQAAHSDKTDRSQTQGLLASYKQLLQSDTVLIQTVEQLPERPMELAGVKDRSAWPLVLRQMLTVTYEPTEHVLEMRCLSGTPEGALYVIQSLMAASSKYMEDYQQNLSLTLMKQLESKQMDIEATLVDKERHLLDERRKCGDIAIGEASDQSHPIVQRVSQLNTDLISVRSRRLELESMLINARKLVTEGADLTASLNKLEEIVGPKALSQIPGTGGADVEMLDELTTELSVMEGEFAALRRHFGLGHSEIVRRQSLIEGQKKRIVAIQSAMDSHVRSGFSDPRVGHWLINTLTTELASTEQYEATLQRDYNDAESSAVQLSDKLAFISFASREVELLREQHSTLSNRLSSLKIEQGGGAFRVAPLSDPLLSQFAVYPILSKSMSMFCFAAIVLGLAIIYVIDLLDDTLRSPEEVRDELGLPVLGVIRKIPDDEIDQSMIYVHAFPQTPHAECFRTLKTSLTMAPGDTKCIAITSSEASEGKTTTVVNLAASYAQTGKRTLLIDADMRRPGLSRLLEVRGHGGLSEILRGDADIPGMCKERTVSTEVPLLDVLPCGPRILNAGMLLSMPTLADILDWAVAEYDQVIVDCPPTLPVSDAAVVGRFVDGILFLMNPDKTHRRSVARAVDQLKSMELKIVGIVANTSMSDENKGYGYQYGYGYASDYSYGHDDDELESDDDRLVTTSGSTGIRKAA
ncbi:MAG: polysaccharide biosynthesis tyrosine autokinase [Fuerstiella sp.]|nr:polysaccharide biosynthesis tyrosine autokinase [Fuerstiella sp.]